MPARAVACVVPPPSLSTLLLSQVRLFSGVGRRRAGLPDSPENDCRVYRKYGQGKRLKRTDGNLTFKKFLPMKGESFLFVRQLTHNNNNVVGLLLLLQRLRLFKHHYLINKRVSERTLLPWSPSLAAERRAA